MSEASLNCCLILFLLVYCIGGIKYPYWFFFLIGPNWNRISFINWASCGQHPPQTVLPELSDHSWAPASDRRESFWLPTEWRTLGKSPIAQLKERVRDLGSQLPYSRASVLGLSFQAVQRHKSRILNLKIEQMNRILAFFSFFSFSFKCNFSLSQEFQYEAHIFFMSALFSATFVSSLCVPAFPLTAGHITIPFFYWLWLK